MALSNVWTTGARNIYRVNLYPVDSTISFPNTYLLDSDLSSGWRYPTFEQLTSIPWIGTAMAPPLAPRGSVLFRRGQLIQPDFKIVFFLGGGAEGGSICSCGAWNIHRVNLYPVDSAISFPNTYALDTDTICSDYKKVTK